MIITIAKPIKKDGKSIGVLAIDITLDYIKNSVEQATPVEKVMDFIR